MRSLRRMRGDPELGPALIPGLALLVMALAFGLSYRFPRGGDLIFVESVETVGQVEKLGQEKIVGELLPGELCFKNSGRVGCQLRVKLFSAQINEKPVLRAGHATGDGSFFQNIEGGHGEYWSYWTCRGEYLYYQDSRTGGLLLPGRTTPPVYSTLRVNENLTRQELHELWLIEAAWRMQAVVEVRAGEDEDWRPPSEGHGGEGYGAYGAYTAVGHWDLRGSGPGVFVNIGNYAGPQKINSGKHAQRRDRSGRDFA